MFMSTYFIVKFCHERRIYDFFKSIQLIASYQAFLKN